MALMSPASKSDWHPSAHLAMLRARATIIARVRQFFADRGVLEVETPLLARTTVTDAHLHSFTTAFRNMQGRTETFYLQTSPEYAMKRLLAAGLGSIYQISKAFRNDEVGYKHNPEFTLLEWYRVDFEHHQLMNEVDALLQVILACPAAKRVSYHELFQQYFDINPHTITLAELQTILQTQQINLMTPVTEIDTALDLLLTHVIEPQFANETPVMIYDYPASQSALAKLRQVDNYRVAERFEVYYRGCELANGFHELQDANEQRTRFIKNLAERAEQNLPQPAIDEKFLSALQAGMPACAGVALGMDRLIMLATHAKTIQEVLAFAWAAT